MSPQPTIHQARRGYFRIQYDSVGSNTNTKLNSLATTVMAGTYSDGYVNRADVMENVDGGHFIIAPFVAANPDDIGDLETEVVNQINDPNVTITKFIVQALDSVPGAGQGHQGYHGYGDSGDPNKGCEDGSGNSLIHGSNSWG